jgi:hypothetical protein
MSTIAVSSFCLYRELGPLYLSGRDAEGQRTVSEFPLPTMLTMAEFIAAVPERFGVFEVELCQIHFQENTRDYIGLLKNALEDAGVSLRALPIDVGNLSDPDPAHRDEDIAEITQWFDVAATLGAEFVRVRIGDGSVDDLREDDSSVVESLNTLADRAESRGLRLLIENHGGASSTPDVLASIIDKVGRTRLGMLLDLGNFEPISEVSTARILGHDADDSSLETEQVYERIAKIAPFASLVHAKAYDPRTDGTPLLDLDRALTIVADAGYTGDVSIEWEGLQGDPWDRTLETMAAVRRVFPDIEPSRT